MRAALPTNRPMPSILCNSGHKVSAEFDGGAHHITYSLIKGEEEGQA